MLYDAFSWVSIPLCVIVLYLINRIMLIKSDSWAFFTLCVLITYGYLVFAYTKLDRSESSYHVCEGSNDAFSQCKNFNFVDEEYEHPWR